MPRVDGEFVAPYPPVVPDTTIESEVHNGIVADFVADANAARPVTAGGTGATNPTGARSNLAVEQALQQVTNFDSHIFEAGSFFAFPGATGAPVEGHTFTGIVYGIDANLLVVEARDADDGSIPGLKYIREKIDGVWGSWTSEVVMPTVMFNTNNYITSDGTNVIIRTGGETYNQDLVGDLTPLNVATPTAAIHAATKGYVDTVGVGGALPKSGGVMTGDLTLTIADPMNMANPTAASRGYADASLRAALDLINALTARIEELERKIK